MDIKTLDHAELFTVLDQTYGLIDGSTRWPDYLGALLGLSDISGCALFIYDCARGQSQLVETRGHGRPAAGSGGNLAIDDFLWRSALGAVWRPNGRTDSPTRLNAGAMRSRPDSDLADGYAVIDRDHTHILFLAMSAHRPGQRLEPESLTLLENLLAHLHRACRLKRVTQGGTLMRLVHPDRAASVEPSSLPIELRLRRRFRLSKAEARVAKLMAEGLAPRMIADRLHVSIHTVRSQLQSIFQKTDTCRQAELTSLLLRETEIPAALCQARPLPLDNQERPSCL